MITSKLVDLLACLAYKNSKWNGFNFVERVVMQSQDEPAGVAVSMRSSSTYHGRPAASIEVCFKASSLDMHNVKCTLRLELHNSVGELRLYSWIYSWVLNATRLKIKHEGKGRYSYTYSANGR